MFTQEQLKLAAAGDMKTLVELDQRGLFPGMDESTEDYSLRLAELARNTADMDRELADNKVLELAGLKLSAADRIPVELFREAAEQTEQLYKFSIDWVPGFFVTPFCGWLFAGCAYSFAPQFYSLFIVSRKFIHHDKWLIYNRRELLAHEFCHVARGALAATAYEETFAYKTAGTGFRRELGGVFRRAADSFLLLLSVLLLLGVQVLHVFRPGMSQTWGYAGWAAVGAVLFFLAGRHLYSKSRLKRALELVAEVAGEQNALPVLFRCCDHEIRQISRLHNAHALVEWLQKRCRDSWRWRVVRYRFLAVTTE